MNKRFISFFLSTTIVLSVTPAAFANGTPTAIDKSNKTDFYFSDIEQYGAKADIEYLLGRDIVKGYETSEFRPNAQLSYAEAIQLITKSFQLKLNQSKEVQPNNYLDSNKWYSGAFNIALTNEMDLPENVNVNDIVTREQFAGWIIDELDRIGVYPVIRMYIHIKDSEDISEKHAGKVQTLLLTRIANLSEEQTFRPKDAITRGEAADWLADAVKFAEQLKSQQEADILSDLSFEFNDDMKLTAQQAQTLLNKAFELEKTETANTNDNKNVTREQFAGWIVDELNKKGPFPVKMMFIHVSDEQEISQDISHKVQTLLLTDIAELNEAGKFRPQDEIIGAEAIEWLQKAVEFINRFN